MALAGFAIWATAKKPKKEMTATERMAYETERGKLLAQQESKRNWRY